MTVHGVGIDVADVSRLARLVERGETFTRRWFTPDEVTECAAAQVPADAYAGRFAAKEAVWKAMGLQWDGPVPWLSIAVVSAGDGLAVRLDGAVGKAAGSAGVGSISVTISATASLATAVAIAERR